MVGKVITFKYFLSLSEANQSPIIVKKNRAFSPSYGKLAHIEGVRDRLREFFRCKKQWPQEKLLASFKDHALQGSYFKKHKIMECHLAGDVLLLYSFDNNVLTLLFCCSHNDLYGGRINNLQKLLDL